MKSVFLIVALLIIASCTTDINNVVGASMGDTVKLNYIGTFPNGTLFDTNVQHVAEAHGVSKPAYEPLQVTIGKGQVIPGFESALLGMKVGDKKKVTIYPEQAYGVPDPSKVVSAALREEFDRIIRMEREFDVPTVQFDSVAQDYEEGESVLIGETTYDIISITDNVVRIKSNVKKGQVVRLPESPWNSTVVDIDDVYYYLRHDPEDGGVINGPLGPARLLVTENKLVRESMLKTGQRVMTPSGLGTVIDIDDEKASIDFNHPLAGKTLVFEIELIEELPSATANS